MFEYIKNKFDSFMRRVRSTGSIQNKVETVKVK